MKVESSDLSINAVQQQKFGLSGWGCLILLEWVSNLPGIFTNIGQQQKLGMPEWEIATPTCKYFHSLLLKIFNYDSV